MTRLPDIPFDLYWDDQAKSFSDLAQRTMDSWAFRVNAEDEEHQVPDAWSYSEREHLLENLDYQQTAQQDAEQQYYELRQQEANQARMAQTAPVDPNIGLNPQSAGLLPDFDAMLESRGLADQWPTVDPAQPTPGYEPDPGVQENAFEPVEGFQPVLGDLHGPEMPYGMGSRLEERQRRIDETRATADAQAAYEQNNPVLGPSSAGVVARETGEERFARETEGKPWHENIGPAAGRALDMAQGVFGGAGDYGNAGYEHLSRRYPEVYGSVSGRHTGKVTLDQTLARMLEPLDRAGRINKIAELKEQGVLAADAEVPLEFDRTPTYMPTSGTPREDRLTWEDTRVPEELNDLRTGIEYNERWGTESERALTQTAAGAASVMTGAALGTTASAMQGARGAQTALRTAQAAVDPIEGGVQGVRVGAQGVRAIGDAAQSARENGILSDYGRTVLPELPGPGQIISPHVARTMYDTPIRADYSEDFRATVEELGGRITPEGLEINLQRFQNEGVGGEATLRGGVFYGPKDPYDSWSPYRNSESMPGTVGGPEEIAGPTLFRNPFIVAGEQPAYAVLVETKGQEAAERIASTIESRFGPNGTGPKPTIRELRDFLVANGGDGDVALDIASTWGTRHWNTEFALMENIGAAAARQAGYDALIESSGRGIGEIHDIRESALPTPGGEAFLRTDMLRRGGYVDAPGATVAGAARRDAAMGAIGGSLIGEQAEGEENGLPFSPGGAAAGALGMGAVRFTRPGQLGDALRSKEQPFRLKEILNHLDALSEGGHDIGMARNALDDADRALEVGDHDALLRAQERLARELGSEAPPVTVPEPTAARTATETVRSLKPGQAHVVGFGYMAEDQLDDVSGAVEKMLELSAARGPKIGWDEIMAGAHQDSLPAALRRIEEKNPGQDAIDIENLREAWRQGHNRMTAMAKVVDEKRDIRVMDEADEATKMDMWDSLTSMAAVEEFAVRAARGVVKAGSEAGRTLNQLKNTGYAQQGRKYIQTLEDFSFKAKKGRRAASRVVEDIAAGRDPNADRLADLEALVHSMELMVGKLGVMGDGSKAVDAVNGHAANVLGTSVSKRARKLEKASDDGLAKKAAETLRKADLRPDDADVQLQLDAVIAETARRRRSHLADPAATPAAPVERPVGDGPPSAGPRASAEGGTPREAGTSRRPMTPSEAEARAEDRHARYPLELRVQEAYDKERVRIQRLQDRMEARLGKQAKRYMEMVESRNLRADENAAKKQINEVLKGEEETWRTAGRGLIGDLRESMSRQQRHAKRRESLSNHVKQGKLTQQQADDAFVSWLAEEPGAPSYRTPEQIEREFGRLMVGLHDQGHRGRSMVVELQNSMDAMVAKESDALLARQMADARKRLVLQAKWTDRNAINAYIERIKALMDVAKGQGNRNPGAKPSLEDLSLTAEETASLFDDLETMGDYATKQANDLRTSIIKSGLVKYVGSTEDHDVVAAAMAAMRNLDTSNPKAVQTLIRSLRSPRAVDYIKETGVVNMLSNPATWWFAGVNFSANLMNLGGRNFVQMPGMAAVESVTAGIQKVRGKEYERQAYWKELPAAYVASVKGGMAGWNMGMEIMKQGYLEADMAEAAIFGKYGTVPREFLSESNRASDLLGAGLGAVVGGGQGDSPEERIRNAALGAVGGAGYSVGMRHIPGSVKGVPLSNLGNFGLMLHMISTRPLAAADAFIGHMLYAGQYAAMAERKAARSKGKFTAEDILRNPLDHDDVRTQAGSIRDYTLLKQQSGVTKRMLSGITSLPHTSARRQFAEGALFQFVPFLTVTSNFLSQGLELSPAGAAWKLGKAVAAKDEGLEAGRADALVKSAVGAALTAGAIQMYSAGMLTGSGQFDSEARERWPEGREPNSILLGGKWVSLNGTPMAIPFGMVANAMEWQEAQARTAKEKGEPEPDALSKILTFGGSAAAGAGMSILGHPFMQGVMQIGSAVQGRLTTDRLIYGQTSRYIPANGMLRYLAAMGDEFQREAKGDGWGDTLIQRYEAGIPGMRNDVPQRQGPLGQPLKEDTYVGRGDVLGAVAPFPRRHAHRDPSILQLMRRYEVSPPDPPTTEEGVRLKPMEALAIQRVSGRYLMEREADIRAAVEGYGTDREKQDELRRWALWARKQAGYDVRSNITGFDARREAQQGRMR